MNQRTYRAENFIYKVFQSKSKFVNLRIQFKEMVFDVERRETLGADQTGENILRIISQENKFDK